MFSIPISDWLPWSDDPKHLFAHVHRARALPGIVLAHGRRVEAPLHGAVLAQPPGRRSRVDTGQTRNTCGRKPFMQRAARRVMAAPLDIILDHEPQALNAPRF